MASTSVVIRDFTSEIPGGFDKTKTAWLFPPITYTSNTGKEHEWRVMVRMITSLPQATPMPSQYYTSKIIKTWVGNRLDVVDDEVDDDPNMVFVKIPNTWFNCSQDTIHPKYGACVGWIKVVSGMVGGKMRKVVPTIITTGKNIGRSNETNIWCQALRDALSIYNKQIKKSNDAAHHSTASSTHRRYRSGSSTTLYPPMLAQVFDEDKVQTQIPSWPVYVQRKYNGVRAITMFNSRSNEVLVYSRKRHEYPNLGIIKDELAPILKHYKRQHPGKSLYIDGELYAHGRPLQEISGMMRRITTTQCIRDMIPGFSYMIYDVFVINDKDGTLVESVFDVRLSIMLDIIGPMLDKIKDSVCQVSDTWECNDLDEIKSVYNDALSDGFEGAMIRLNTSPYVFSYSDYHSPVLLKMKPTYDAEFELIDYTEGRRGKAKGALMLICQTVDKKGKIRTFNVTPAMETDERKRLFELFESDSTMFDKIKGKMMVVEFAEYSRDGIPCQPRTRMLFRDMGKDETYAVDL